MNDTSHVTRSGANGNCESVARVHPFEHGHAVVVANAGVELAVADVERDHPGRAALEEHVCEAAGRSSDVERIATRYFDAERIESVRELLAAPGDVRRRLLDGQLASTRRPARPLWHGPGPGPAMTSACAWARLSASPRSTSSTSSRFLTASSLARASAHA